MDYQPELFEWTQFDIPAGFDEVATFARLIYIEEHCRLIDKVQFFTFKLSEDAFTGIIEQCEPFSGLEVAKPDAEKAEAEESAATKHQLPVGEVRLMQIGESGKYIF